MQVYSDFEIIKLDPNVIYETDDEEDAFIPNEFNESCEAYEKCEIQEKAANFVFNDNKKIAEEENKQIMNNVDDSTDKEPCVQLNDVLKNVTDEQQKPRKKLNLAEYKIVRANRPAPQYTSDENEKIVLELCEIIPDSLPPIELPTDPRSIKALLNAPQQQKYQPEPMQIDETVTKKELPSILHPDYEEIVLISKECNTDISISPHENDQEPGSKAPSKFLTNIVNTIQSNENAKTLLNSSSTLFSSINAVVREKCNISLNETKIENVSDRKSSEHGENKVIMHLRKDRIRAAHTNVALQTETSPLFPPLILSPALIFNRIKNSRNFRKKSRSPSQSRSRSRSRSRSFSPENDYYKRSHYSKYRSLYSSTVNSSEFDSSTESDSSAYSSCRSSDYDSTRKYDNRYISQPYRNQRPNYRYEDERKVVYIGGLSEETSKEDLRRKFLKYGTIKKISQHVKEDVNGQLRFGFITFAEASAAYDVLDRFKLDPTLCDFDIRFGGRRRFCKQSYADLDSLPKENDIDVYNDNNNTIKKPNAKGGGDALSFEELLEIARQKLCRDN